MEAMNKIKIFSKSQFSLLWWSGTISSFGDWATLFGSVALASYLGTEAGNSELTAIVPLIARIIPALLSSFAGLIADRYNKKIIMIFCDLIRMVFVMLLFFAGNLYSIFILNFLSEIFSLIRQPSRESVVPELVSKENLVKANSLFAIGTYATLPIASLALGVVSDLNNFEIINNIGNGWKGSIIFLFDTFTFLASVIFLYFLKNQNENAINKKPDVSFKNFKEGLDYFFKSKDIRNISFSISFCLIGAGALFILGHTFLTVDLGFSESSFGFMIASFGSGILFSMLTLSYFVTTFSRVNFLIGISMMLTGISLLSAFRSTDFFVILLSIFISGIGTGGVYLLTISYLQASTNNDIRGRVFGNFYTIGRLALLLSFLLSGIIANYLDGVFGQDGVYLVLIGSSILIFISGILNFINGYRSIFNEFGIEKSNFNKIKLNLDEKE
jgi:dTMP kinase